MSHIVLPCLELILLNANTETLVYFNSNCCTPCTSIMNNLKHKYNLVSPKGVIMPTNLYKNWSSMHDIFITNLFPRACVKSSLRKIISVRGDDPVLFYYRRIKAGIEKAKWMKLSAKIYNNTSFNPVNGEALVVMIEIGEFCIILKKKHWLCLWKKGLCYWIHLICH